VITDNYAPVFNGVANFIFRKESAADPFFIRVNFLSSYYDSGASSVPIPGSKYDGLERRFKRGIVVLNMAMC
jgi:hypothetical protein